MAFVAIPMSSAANIHIICLLISILNKSYLVKCNTLLNVVLLEISSVYLLKDLVINLFTSKLTPGHLPECVTLAVREVNPRPTALTSL